jgi:cephalosporin-C deacetylase-like acetyl esterase
MAHAAGGFAKWACVVAVAVPWLHGQTANRSIIVDGRLDDALWQSVPAEKLIPSQPGVVPEAVGEIRAVVSGRYFYVGARLREPTGRITARLMGRNPSWEDEDLLRIVYGTDISSTDRILQINPFGAYSIEKAIHVPSTVLDVFPYSLERLTTQVMYRDASRFLVAAAIGDKEWTVEAAIPLNELSAAASGSVLARIERLRATRPGSPQDRWHWPERGPAAKIPALPSKWDEAVPVFRPTPMGNKEAPITVGRVNVLPALDSGWEAGQWRDAPGWDLLRDEPLPRRPRFPATVKLLHDGRTLAVLARCVEPDGTRARVRETDGSVAQDDSFHVYLATSGSAYTQFVVNPLGYLLDNQGFFGGQRLSRAREWDSGTRVNAREEKGAWYARLDIPLAEAVKVLGEEEPPAEWRVLFLRVRQSRPDEPLEKSSLPVTQSDTPLCTPRYRRLALASTAASGLSGPPQAAPVTGLASLDGRVLSRDQRRAANLAEMLPRHIAARIRTISEDVNRQWEQVSSRSDWERFTSPKIQALKASFGEFPQRTPLQMRVLKEYAANGYRRQDLVYQSRSGMWVTANLYLPAKPPSRMPGILIVHSHHRPRTQAELQDMGILWARAGCAVLIMDQIGHGERIQNYPWNREAYHSRYILGMQLYLVGESLLKWMVWDVMRGIDLLLARKDVNPDQIILLGAVAAGGEPVAVTAALDQRVAAVAPFNFNRATPGSGEWESTRCLRRSIVDQFFPWIIDASVAPRRLIYSVEMGWESYREHTSWERFKKVFAFYSAPDNLDEAHGFGTFPGPGECANIGPAQRQTMYPELKRWFGIPIPAAEPDDRRPEAELASLTPATARELNMKPIHHLASEVATSKLTAARTVISGLTPSQGRERLRAGLRSKLGEIEANRQPPATLHWKKQVTGANVEGITLEVEPGILLPVLLLRPTAAQAASLPVVVAVSEAGKERFLSNRTGELEALLKAGVAVCLPDVRGTGETAGDTRRARSSEETSAASTEFMLGNTLLGGRLKDLRTVLAYLGKRQDLDSRRIALWGDSFAPVNPQKLLLDEVPGWQIGPEIQNQAEPLGGLLALLGSLYEENVHAVAVRGGLAAYVSILEGAFVYVPNDIIVPGILEVGDVADVAAALAPRPLLLEGLVDGRNQMLAEAELRDRMAGVRQSYSASASNLLIRSTEKAPDLAHWLVGQLR